MDITESMLKAAGQRCELPMVGNQSCNNEHGEDDWISGLPSEKLTFN